MFHACLVLEAACASSAGTPACPELLRKVAPSDELQRAWSLHLPEQPDLAAVQEWFANLFDPKGQTGEALFHDPAFRKAFKQVLRRRIDAADISPEHKVLLREALRERIKRLTRDAKDSPQLAGPGMKADAIARRRARYKEALEAYFHAESFRRLWSTNLPAYPDLQAVEAKVGEILGRFLGDHPHLLSELQDGRSPLGLSQETRDVFRSVVEDFIEHAVLPRAEKERMRERLRAALDGLARQHRIQREEAARREGRARAAEKEDGWRPTEQQARDLKKEIEDYLKTERFRNCVVRTGVLTGAAVLVALTAGSLGIRDEVGDPNKSFAGQAVDPQTYLRGLTSRRLAPLLVWDALLATSIGGLMCINTQVFAGRSKVARWALKRENLNGYILAPLTGAVAELFTGSVPHVGDAILGTLWVRYISLYKTALAMRTAQRYRAAGLPAAGAVEFALQLLSEALGAFFYPQVQRLLFPNDDEKKKKKDQ